MCLGIPGQVLDTTERNGLRLGTVAFGDASEPNRILSGGIRKEVCLAFVPEATVGDYVIVHVGFAITKVDEAEAHRTLAVLRAMSGVIEAELGAPG